MKTLRTQRRHFGILVKFAGLILLNLAIPAGAQQPHAPSTVLNRTYTLYLVTRHNTDGCTAVGELQWRPETPGSANLLVGDALRVAPLVIEEEAQVLTWTGRWDWKTSQKCGKNTCETDEQRVQNIPSKVKLGESLVVSVFIDGKENKVTSAAIIDEVRIEPGIFAIQASFAPFLVPEGKKPDSRASLAQPFCVSELRPEVKLMEVSVVVFRRFQ